MRVSEGRCSILAVAMFFSLACSFSGCSSSSPVTELRGFPLDTLDGIITRSGVELDDKVSSDGGGSLRIVAAGPLVVRLFETGDLDVDNARLIYQARVRTEGVEGEVYLEMYCHFPGQGEFFSRGFQSALKGTNDWASQETLFLLKKGENPDNVKLNLVFTGRGVAWIDDIRLLQGGL